MEMLQSFFMTGFKWGAGLTLGALGFAMGVALVLLVGDILSNLFSWIEKNLKF